MTLSSVIKSLIPLIHLLPMALQNPLHLHPSNLHLLMHHLHPPNNLHPPLDCLKNYAITYRSYKITISKSEGRVFYTFDGLTLKSFLLF